MPDLRTCLTLGAFDPEDVAEIRGFIDASGGDQAAGVGAYLASLESDLDGLRDQVAEALGIRTQPFTLNQEPVDPVTGGDLAEGTIIGPDGQPVRLFHGTSSQFVNFNNGEIFFTNQRSLAIEHSRRSGAGSDARIIEANVALDNAYTLEIPSGESPDTFYLSNAAWIKDVVEGRQAPPTRPGETYNPNAQAQVYDGLMIWNPEGELLVIAQRDDQIRQIHQTGSVLFQSGADDDPFHRWAGVSRNDVIDPHDINETDFSKPGPYVMRVFHGTTHDFDQFDASERGNIENAFGRVNYFTSDEGDARQNYAGEGPDLTNRIQLRVEGLNDRVDYDFGDLLDANLDMETREELFDDLVQSLDGDNFDASSVQLSDFLDDEDFDLEAFSRHVARSELSGGQDRVIEAYVRTERPFVVDDHRSPLMETVDFEEIHNDAMEEIADDEGISIDELRERMDEFEDQVQDRVWELQSNIESPLALAVQKVAGRYDIDPSELIGKLYEWELAGGITHQRINDTILAADAVSYSEDPDTGAMAAHQVLAEIIEELGFDSIILKNADQRFQSMEMGSGTAHVHVFDQFNTNIKSVENRGTFDRRDPRFLFQDEIEPRGQIEIPAAGVGNADTVITLFETADQSTFLHESAHFFLEVMLELDAPELATDMAVIRKHLGMADGQRNPTTEQQEIFARSFEAYLMEGKAPSLELADVFSMVRQWLVRIYNDIRGLNVEINDDIRQVFDRMLATDDAIAEAKAEMAIRNLFTTKPPSMSDADWNTYQRMARRGDEQATSRLQKRVMDRITREKKKWWREERAATLEGVEREMSELPQYRLIEALGNGRWIGEEDIELPDMKIDRDQLVSEFGQDVLKDMDRSAVGGRSAIYGPDGASLEEVADFFGFRDKAEMISELRAAGKMRDRAAEETDRRMLERHGDPLNDGTLEAEALEAIHSEQAAAANVAEARELRRQLGQDPTGMTAKVYRARAEDMIRRMTVAQASKPQKFLTAERKASREAQQAFARVARGGGSQALANALAAKERQILNQHLYTASRKLEGEVNKGREKMMRYRKPSVRQKLEGGYIEQIDALLEQYDFRRRSPGQVERDENLQGFIERMTAEGRAAQLNIDPQVLRRAGQQGRHYTRLSVEELRGLLSTVENIDHLGRLKQTLIDRQEKRNLDQVVGAIRGEIRDNVKGRPPSRIPDPSEERKKGVRDYLNSTLNADTLLREIDGFEDLGPTWTNLKKSIDEGQARLTERRFEMGKEFDRIYGRYKGKRREMSKRQFDPDLGFSLTQWDRIAMALNMGNADNFQRLTNPKVKGSVTATQAQIAVDKLTAKDWETVQMIWDYLESFWPEISELEKRSKGTAPPKVEAAMQVKAPSGITGGYYPIKYDARLSGLADDFQNKDLAESLMSGQFGKAQTAQGHTEARNATATQPLLLDLGVAHQHVDQVIYDLEMREPVTNSWRILQDPRIRTALTEKGKGPDWEALEIWLLDVASGERLAARGLYRWMRHVRVGFTVSRLAMNLSTALIQPTGLLQSAVVVGKREVAAGTASYMSNPARWVREVREVSPLMRERQRTFERDIYNAVGDLQRGPMSGWQKFQRDYVLPASFVLMQSVQFYSVDMPTWVAAYKKELGRSGDEAKARTFADTMVKRAQGSGLMADRGALERGTLDRQRRQHEAPKMLTALGSYMFAKGNVAYEQIQSTNFRSPTEVMSLAVDIALLFTMEAVLYSAVKGFLPEEDEGEPEDWAKWLAQETALSAMSTMPYARELSGALQGFGGGGIYGAGVEILARPMIQASQGEIDRALLTSVVDAGGMLLHLPGSQAKSALRSLLDEDGDLRDEVSPAEFLGLSRPGNGRSLADFVFED